MVGATGDLDGAAGAAVTQDVMLGLTAGSVEEYFLDGASDADDGLGGIEMAVDGDYRARCHHVEHTL